MKAVAVTPGRPDSIHLRDVAMPSLADLPDERGVLVKTLRVGVDGTDKEINGAEYGAPPAGADYLVIGHESFGVVEAVGANVTQFQRRRLRRRIGTPAREQSVRPSRAAGHDDRRHVLRAWHQPAPLVPE